MGGEGRRGEGRGGEGQHYLNNKHVAYYVIT